MNEIAKRSAVAKVAAQRCHDQPGIRLLAVELRLPGEETPNLLRPGALPHLDLAASGCYAFKGL